MSRRHLIMLLALAALGIGGSAVAYLLSFAIMIGAGAVVYGATLLDEPVSVAALAGLALILGGGALGTGTVRRWRATGPT